MARFTGIIGIIIILLIAFLLSNNRSKINYRQVLVGLGLQLGLALFILKLSFGQKLFQILGDGISTILSFSDKGGAFIFGPLVDAELMGKTFGANEKVIFFFKIIPNIIFVALLVNILYHLGIMQRAISLIAKVVYKLMRVSGSEALSNVASAFVGQVEAQIMIKPYINGMTLSELLASMTGSMACISGGVMAVYISFGIPANFLLAANIMAAPGALVISKIVFPETQKSETQGIIKIKVEKEYSNLLDAIAQGASTGFKVSLNVIAMLIGFIALVSLLDYILGSIGLGLSHLGLNFSLIGIDLKTLNFKQILGGIFSWFAWIMGIPGRDIHNAGALMGTKMVLNEFVAYIDLKNIRSQLDPKTVMITTFALCGFANFSSIAIQVGGISELAPKRRADLAKLGFKALICGTLASYLSASIAGILF
jgi:CNT family concentrative nucleoside transporter